VLWAGVFCPIDIIMARRNAAPRWGFYLGGKTVPEPVRRWQAAVHADKRYDLEVDGGKSTRAEAATRILAAIGARAAAGRVSAVTADFPSTLAPRDP
jgi:chloramphenicol 3-O phosphotransferase